MKYYHFLFVSLGLTSAAILASCQDEDFGYTADQIAYRTNFEKMYGSVKDIPTWDFSSYNLRQMGLEGGPSNSSITRAGVRPANYTGTVTGATVGDGIIKNQITEGINISSYGDYYSVQQGTLDWLNANLPEGVRTPLNVTKGNPFVLGVPESDFAIIPIYQGHAGMCWDLHLVADGKDYNIWSKSQGIRYEENYGTGVEYHYGSGALDGWQGEDPNKYATKIWLGGAFPESLRSGSSKKYIKIVIPEGATLKGQFTNWDGTTTWNFDGMGVGTGHTSNTYTYEVTDWPDFGDLRFQTGAGTNGCVLDGYNAARVRFYAIIEGQTSSMKELGSDVSNLTGHTVDRNNVQAKPILIDHTKIKSDFFLYLKITAGDPDNSSYASVGDCQRSDEGMMVALPLDKPDNIDSNKEYMIIGCEDSANPDASDWDVNDIVFLLVGQGNLPRVKETISKRYMIEDLGSTFDFDFNDIVVDVSQTQSIDYKGDVKETVQTANLVHLCGTIPFQLKIGNTQLGKVNGNNGGCSVGGTGFDPSSDPTTYSSYLNVTINGWNPKTNNIEVTVWPSEAGSTKYTGQENGLLAHPEGKSYSFPTNGEFPYIISCDQSVNWMPESYTVPENWFSTWPASFDNWNHGTDNSQPVTPPTPTPTTVDLSSDKIGDGWNADKASYPTVTFSQNWAGFQWWYGGEDFSGYSKIVVTYTRASGSENLPLQLVVEYTTEDGVGEDDKAKYKQSVSGLVTNGSTLEVTLSNDYKSDVRQIFIQNGEGTGSITVTRAYAEKSN